MKDYKIVRTYLYNEPYYVAYKRHYLFFWKKYREFGEEEFQSMKRTLMKFINMDIEDCYIIKTKHCK
jgi:hypothetical protein